MPFKCWGRITRPGMLGCRCVGFLNNPLASVEFWFRLVVPVFRFEELGSCVTSLRSKEHRRCCWRRFLVIGVACKCIIGIIITALVDILTWNTKLHESCSMKTCTGKQTSMKPVAVAWITSPCTDACSQTRTCMYSHIETESYINVDAIHIHIYIIHKSR